MSKQYDETGFSKPKGPDTKCQGILDFLRPAVELQCGKTFSAFSCKEYSEQEVYGRNYKIRVQTPEENLRLHAYEQPNGKIHFSGVDRVFDEELGINLPINLKNHIVDFSRRDKLIQVQLNLLLKLFRQFDIMYHASLPQFGGKSGNRFEISPIRLFQYLESMLSRLSSDKELKIFWK